MDSRQIMKRVGITGATGAIGLALINKCIESGTEAYVFLRRESGRIARIPEHPLIHKIFCSLEEMAEFDPGASYETPDNEEPKTGLPKLDVFYHFAWMKAFGEEARDDLKTQIKNVEYAIDSVELAYRLGCRRYVGAGSQAEYGRKDTALKPDTPCDPESGYGMAKLTAGQMTRLQCEKHGMEHIWTRVLSVYGPGDGDGTLVMSVIRDALVARDPECTKAEQLWDYLYSKDAGRAFYALGERGIPGKTYVLGSGETRLLREYIDEICVSCAEIKGLTYNEKHSSNASHKPVRPEYGAKPYSAKQVMHLEADISELVYDTGFRPQTPFSKGIRETVSTYAGQIMND